MNILTPEEIQESSGALKAVVLLDGTVRVCYNFYNHSSLVGEGDVAIGGCAFWILGGKIRMGDYGSMTLKVGWDARCNEALCKHLNMELKEEEY